MEGTDVYVHIHTKIEKPRLFSEKERLRRQVRKKKKKEQVELLKETENPWILKLSRESIITPYTPYTHVKCQTYKEAINLAWTDMCALCGSGGSHEKDKMIFCADCGECFHHYCASSNSGIHLSLEHSMSWRCPSCKVCEICGMEH